MKKKKQPAIQPVTLGESNLVKASTLTKSQVPDLSVNLVAVQIASSLNSK